MTCGFCKKEFTARSGQKFCSISCGGKNRRVEDLSVLTNESELSYYLLGLIYSDGCLSKEKTKRFRLTYSNNDLSIMSLVKEACTPHKKLYRNRDGYSVVSHNEEDITYLLRLGMTEQKSLTMKFPDLESHNLLRHFIRGFFDGDGCVFKSRTKSGRKYYEYVFVSFTSGSKEFLEKLKLILETFEIKSNLIKDCRNTNSSYYLKIQKQESVRKFAKFIYENASFFIAYKKEKFDSYDIV